MKKIIYIAILVLIITGPMLADGMLRLDATYNIPLENDKIDGITKNVSFGVGIKFWGIFLASANIYTEIVSGGDDFFNISELKSSDLFSWGLGMEIPMGDIYLGLDWQTFYTGLEYEDGAVAFSDSFKIGLGFDLTRFLSVEVFSRKFFSFDSDIDLDFEDIHSKGVMLGISAVLRLL